MRRQWSGAVLFAAGNEANEPEGIPCLHDRKRRLKRRRRGRAVESVHAELASYGQHLARGGWPPNGPKHGSKPTCA